MPVCQPEVWKMFSLRSPELRWLGAKELRELSASRAYWLLLLAVGLLVGHAFLPAVDTYAEMSGSSGGPAALAEGLRPLDGLIVPTLGSLSLAATLLFPFVVIRLIAQERQSGAWKLLLQSRARISTMLLLKVGALLLGWLIAWAPALIAVLLWKSGGNHLVGRETA